MTSQSVAVVVALTTLSLGSIPMLAQRKDAEAFAVGILIAQDEKGWDLLPIARFDGRRWLNTWPEPVDEDAPFVLPTLSSVPVEWLGRPVPRVWTVWRSDGTTRRTAITGLSTLNGCTRPVVLRTPGNAAWKTQLVFDRLPVIEAVVDVRSSWDEADTVFTQLSEVFAFAEAEALARQQHWRTDLGAEGPQFPLTAPAELRGVAPIEIQRLFRPLRESTRSVYYLEALKRFKQPPENGGDLISLSGWIRLVNGRLNAIDIVAGVAYSNDEKSNADLEPLGIVRLGGRAFWISYAHQYESIALVVTDVSETDIRNVVIAGAGGC